MPNVLLSVPHFEQSRDGMCLPACARMVLAYLGQPLSEAELAKQLGSRAIGTPVTNITRLQKSGYQVELGSLDEERLKSHLIAGKPVIVRVWTGMLTTWKTQTSHVVVVVGFDETQIYMNDPAFISTPQAVLWDSFLAAWAEFDKTGAVITR